MSATDLLLNLHPEPIPVYKFKVYIQLLCLGFSRISNLEESIATEAFHEGGVNDRVYSLSGALTQERTLVMERGVALRGALSVLLSSQFAVGSRIRSDILITVHKRDGAIGKIFEVQGAVVRKLSFSTLDALSDEAFIESFELTYETMKSLDMAAGVLGTVGSETGLGSQF